jgi:hypothetical protein
LIDALPAPARQCKADVELPVELPIIVSTSSDTGQHFVRTCTHSDLVGHMNQLGHLGPATS